MCAATSHGVGSHHGAIHHVAKGRKYEKAHILSMLAVKHLLDGIHWQLMNQQRWVGACFMMSVGLCADSLLLMSFNPPFHSILEAYYDVSQEKILSFPVGGHLLEAQKPSIENTHESI